MPTLLEAFDGLPDPWMERTRLHALRDIVILSILAVICGADGFVQIEDFGRAKEDWLGKVLDLPNGIPSHDTIGRVFSLLDPEAFAASFMAWVGSGAERGEGEVVAIDGKTARRSMDGAGDRICDRISRERSVGRHHAAAENDVRVHHRAGLASAHRRRRSSRRRRAGGGSTLRSAA